MKNTTVIMTLLVTLAAIFFKVAQAEEVGAIQQCTELLPTEFKYRLILETDIDPSGTDKELVWNITMHDQKNEELPDEEDDRRDKQIEPFIECLLPLIK